MSRRRRLIAGAAIVTGVAGALVGAPAHAAPGCQVSYSVTSQWQGGFGASVTVTNLGDPVSAWHLGWSFGAGQAVTQLWNGSFTQSGAQVTVTNAAYNGSLATGGSTSFGFNGSWTSANPDPTTFTLDGTVCNGSTVTTSPSVTPTPTTPSPTPTTPSPTPTTPSATPSATPSPTPTTPSPTPSTSPPATTTTAWRNGQFVVDTANVVRRSDVVLKHANTTNSQFIPFGNGSLGVASWAANGFTAQLNRNDTMPNRLSPGQVTIPGLSKLTSASNFSGYLDLYDGVLHESGGGMTLTAYVRADAPELVIDVTGADPNTTQTAQVALWSGRSTSAQASGSVATLSQSWVDGGGDASGRTFGAMAGVSAAGRNVTASTPSSLSGRVSFLPTTDGSFRVIVVSPKWTGGNALTTTTSLLGSDLTRSSSDLSSSTSAWWHSYWDSVGLLKISSSNGSGEYLENLRTLYLFYMASINRDTLPGTQAGLADLFTYSQDTQPWYPAGYWFWNLRMFLQANLSSGALPENDPIFALYRTNVSNIAAWTSSKYPGHQGLCVPETMRFNGNGSWYAGNESCDSLIAPSYNAQTVTSGAEIGLWIWQTYLATDDRAFLSANYPVMSGTARFLLSHARTGSDGLLHTTSNAHEDQWSVNDPITDVAAMKALFPVVAQAATTLGQDVDLVSQLNAAIPKIRSLPTTTSGGTTVLALSAQPSAAVHNVENLGLEPVWPYNLIGDSGSQTALARDTFSRRTWPTQPDWSFDSLQAARLGLAGDMQSTLTTMTTKYQEYPSGLASWMGGGSSPYIEQLGVAAATLNEALVQDYDGTLRIAPAWPSTWDADGTVFVQHQGRVHVQIRGGNLVTVSLDAGATGSVTVRNPWPGQSVTVVDGAGTAVLTGATGTTFTIPAQAGTSYLIQRTSSPTTALPFWQVTGSPATTTRSLGNRTIGIP